MYFVSIPAAQIVDAKILKAMGLDSDTQLVAQLGICRKSTQLQMTSIFTKHSRASLRDKRVGSE